MKSIIVSFFTKNTLYSKEAEELIASCKAWNLDYCIEARENLGKWDKNCCQKPLFILEKLKLFKCPVVWVDVDAIILQKPLFELEDYDLALFIRKKPLLVRSGTIYCNYTPQTLKLLERWHERCEEELQKASGQKEIWDQECLQKVIINEKFPVKIKKLPLGYCRVLDRSNEIIKKEDSYIIHFHASTSYRELINGKIENTFLDLLSPDELKKMHLHC
jgi:hypothetical protein